MKKTACFLKCCLFLCSSEVQLKECINLDCDLTVNPLAYMLQPGQPDFLHMLMCAFSHAHMHGCTHTHTHFLFFLWKERKCKRVRYWILCDWSLVQWVTKFCRFPIMAWHNQHMTVWYILSQTLVSQIGKRKRGRQLSATVNPWPPKSELSSLLSTLLDFWKQIRNLSK